MIVLNLFVGVIMGGMDEATKEQSRARDLDEAPASVQSDVAELLTQLDDMRERLERVQSRVRSVSSSR
jgi:division protein CdvB (Snf7/Vps24/ESCRT-III family)